jgi:hypothetical protein
VSRIVRLSFPLALDREDIDRMRTTRRSLDVTGLPHTGHDPLRRYLASEPPGDGVVIGEV